MYRRMGSKGRFSNIEKSERFIRNLDSVCQEPKFLEIWMADLGERSGSLQSGRRPVLIVSNDKNNRYSSVLNVIPMTTKMNKRNLPCHVEIWDYKKYGLLAPSTLLIEQLSTISKENLIYNMGKIIDVDMLMRICRAMQSQFPIMMHK